MIPRKWMSPLSMAAINNTIDEIATHDFVLPPGRYVGAAAVEDDGEPIDEKLTRLRTELLAEFDEADRLEQIIRERLQGLIGG